MFLAVYGNGTKVVASCSLRFAMEGASSSEEGTVGGTSTPYCPDTHEVHAIGGIANQGLEGLNKLQELLKTFTGWQGRCAQATESHDLCVHLFECGSIITEAKSGVAEMDEMVQGVDHVLRDLLCQHTPGDLNVHVHVRGVIKDWDCTEGVSKNN
jgi:hypothetical protein